ncbi:MAG: hypothetical protein SGJ20_08715 [Planctomycetota bacterium]|nr:hypothetical protein [Planctomycetota bacterium]
MFCCGCFGWNNIHVSRGNRPNFTRRRVYTATLPGGTLTVGDKLFSNFELVSIASGGAIAPNASNFQIQGVVDTSTGDYGIRLLPIMNAGNGQQVNANLNFKVSIIPDPNPNIIWQIKDVGMKLTGANASGNGIVNISELVYGGPALSPLLAGIGVSLQAGDNFNNVSLSAVFSPVNEIYVRKDISISGGQVGNAHLSEFFQFYSQVQTIVPEPGTIVLGAIGALFVGCVGYSRRKR